MADNDLRDDVPPPPWKREFPGWVVWEQLLECSNWEEFLPPPSPQRHALLGQKNINGSCSVHSYAETVTAYLGIYSGCTSLAVDLDKFLALAIAKGFLMPSGSSVPELGGVLGLLYGIPLKGTVPNLANDARFRVPDGPGDDLYLLGSSVATYRGYAFPSGSLCKNERQTLLALIYRKHLCKSLKMGPVVTSLDAQPHYSDPRPEGEPYRQRSDAKLSIFERIVQKIRGPNVRPHCVTAYAYDCPETSDVRSLRIVYQENAKGAPDELPRRGLFMDPDAIRHYFVPDLRGMRLSRKPEEGYQTVERRTGGYRIVDGRLDTSPEKPKDGEQGVNREQNSSGDFSSSKHELTVLIENTSHFPTT